MWPAAISVTADVTSTPMISANRPRMFRPMAAEQEEEQPTAVAGGQAAALAQ